MKVIKWWKLSSDESYQVMKVINWESVSRRQTEREDRRPACRVPTLSDRPSNPHKEKQKNFSVLFCFPSCFWKGAVGKESRLLSWTWVEGSLRRVGYRTGLYSSHQSSHTPTCGDRKKYMTMPQLRRGAATNKESFVEASMIGTGPRW